MSGIVADAMFALLADLAWRRPRRILAAAFLLAIAAGVFGASTPSRLSASDNDYQDKGSESYRTFQLLSERTGVLPGPSIVSSSRPPTHGRGHAPPPRPGHRTGARGSLHGPVRS